MALSVEDRRVSREKWYYQDHMGWKVGPITEEEVQRRVAAGDMSPEDLVLHADFGEWRAIGHSDFPVQWFERVRNHVKGVQRLDEESKGLEDGVRRKLRARNVLDEDEVARQVQAKRASTAVVYFESAICQSRARRYDATIADCTRAIFWDPRLAKAYLLRGDAHIRLGEPLRAAKDYGQADLVSGFPTREAHWFYREEQATTGATVLLGPVPTSTLQRWINYDLKPQDLLVRHENYSRFLPAGEDFPSHWLERARVEIILRRMTKVGVDGTPPEKVLPPGQFARTFLANKPWVQAKAEEEDDEGGEGAEGGKGGKSRDGPSFAEIAEAVPVIKKRLKKYFKGLNLDDMFAEPRK